MDGHRFDDLTKRLAGGVAALRSDADAARPPRQPNGAACTRATDCASFK